MTLRVEVTVEVDMARGARSTLHVDVESAGAIPVYYASRLREVLLGLAATLDEALVAQHGDLDPGNASYVPPLPSPAQWSP